MIIDIQAELDLARHKLCLMKGSPACTQDDVDAMTFDVACLERQAMIALVANDNPAHIRAA